MPDVIDRDVQEEEFCNVLLDEFKAGVAAEVRNVIDRSGHKIVNPDDLMTARQKQIGQMRSKKTRRAGDDTAGLLSNNSTSFWHGDIRLAKVSYLQAGGSLEGSLTSILTRPDASEHDWQSAAQDF